MIRIFDDGRAGSAASVGTFIKDKDNLSSAVTRIVEHLGGNIDSQVLNSSLLKDDMHDSTLQTHFPLAYDCTAIVCQWALRSPAGGAPLGCVTSGLLTFWGPIAGMGMSACDWTGEASRSSRIASHAAMLHSNPPNRTL